ncbi:MafI family immunity protein [Streptomyces sp. NPDC001981]|uniref:MafI family immunity protein n=1 Tax=Streptomyces sp. NPDC001981 TaxID=3364628 RepID=UPI00369EAF41
MREFFWRRSVFHRVGSFFLAHRTPDRIVDVRDFLTAGEFSLPFDIMCSWIYEDELPISTEFHERLVRLSEILGSRDLIASMGELVTG